MDLHQLIDLDYGMNGDELLRKALEGGADPELRAGERSESLLHVAARRVRPSALRILLDHGAEIDARTSGGKTAYAHALRRGFEELCELLREGGADTSLNEADRFAVAVCEGRLDEARAMLAKQPGLARTGNPEEDRLLADVSGRNPTEPVAFLIEAGANLTATALDDGTALHQAAWFGQPQNARLLIDAGAPLEPFDGTHAGSPLGWAVHGSRYSGGAEERQELYVDLTRMLLEAGSKMHDPGEAESGEYRTRLLKDATPGVRALLEQAR